MQTRCEIDGLMYCTTDNIEKYSHTNELCGKRFFGPKAVSLFCRSMWFLIISYLVTLLFLASLENMMADERFDSIR